MISLEKLKSRQDALLVNLRILHKTVNERIDALEKYIRILTEAAKNDNYVIKESLKLIDEHNRKLEEMRVYTARLAIRISELEEATGTGRSADNEKSKS